MTKHMTGDSEVERRFKAGIEMTSPTAEQMQVAFTASLPSWVEYTESAAGQLRHAVILHQLRANLPRRAAILDMGAGTGKLSADLGRDGHSMTLLDFSPAMLERARRNCAGLDVTFICADANAVGTLFPDGTFDAILCHSLFEFVSDPQELLAKCVRALRRQGLLSIVFGNRYHAPLQEILLRHDPRRARIGLDEESAGTDLFGLPRHTFYPEEILAMTESNGLRAIGEFGVRIFSDLIGTIPAERDELLALELAASPRLPYRHIARFVQLILEKR
jgi:S-adenosylmethionine-dependent methyltransferase